VQQKSRIGHQNFSEMADFDAPNFFSYSKLYFPTKLIVQQFEQSA